MKHTLLFLYTCVFFMPHVCSAASNHVDNPPILPYRTITITNATPTRKTFEYIHSGAGFAGAHVLQPRTMHVQPHRTKSVVVRANSKTGAASITELVEKDNRIFESKIRIPLQLNGIVITTEQI